MKNKSKKDFIYSVGRRKGASARVRLYLGKGESTVNGKNIEKYFGTTVLKDLWSKPLRLIDGMNTYYVTAKVAGGGIKGQLDAIILGIARALTLVKGDEYRLIMKKAGLLKRDSRIR